MTLTQKPPESVSQFAFQFSKYVAEYLSDPSLQDSRHPLKDRLAIKILLVLSYHLYYKKDAKETSLFRHELLFQDFRLSEDEQWLVIPDSSGHSQRIYTEAFNYLTEVLCKRTQLISTHQAKLTNVHKLLLMLWRYSVEERWLGTRLKRNNRPNIAPVDFSGSFFERTARILEKQYENLTDLSMMVKNIRLKYGALFLSVGTYRCCVADEMSLFDVIEAVPAPLRTTLLQPSPPRWYQPLVEKIILNLNEKYGLLRSCGLSPSDWHERFSVGILRELKELKKLADSYKKQDIDLDNEQAFEKAFATLLAEQGKVAGYTEFKDFKYSEVGFAMMSIPLESIDDENNGNTIVDDPFNPDHEHDLLRLLNDFPEDFTPITGYFFAEVIAKLRSIDSDNGIWTDLVFNDLLAADPYFSGLKKDEVIEKLITKTLAIINKHQVKWQHHVQDE